MSLITSTLRDFLASNTAFRTYRMLWIKARNRTTGLLEPGGLWTGEDHEEMTVEGETRLYYGGQGKIDIAPITYVAGTDVQMQRVDVGPLSPEAQLLLRGYEPRLAPAEIHVRVDTIDGAHVETFRAWRGWIDTVAISTEGSWDQAETVAALTLASSARGGTNEMAVTRSDATYRRRNGDRFGQYLSLGDQVRTYWMTEGK